jgi:hypothetical protein
MHFIQLPLLPQTAVEEVKAYIYKHLSVLPHFLSWKRLEKFIMAQNQRRLDQKCSLFSTEEEGKLQ